MRRIDYLDGLRGVAALIVAINHAINALFPQMFFGAENGPPSLQSAFASTPFEVIINGSFAVYVFFVLSGFVISASADASSRPLPGRIMARVVRLGFPASASVILAAALFFAGVMFPHRAIAQLNHWWIGAYGPDVSVNTSVAEIAGAYFWRGASLLNAVLWTMQRELIGSIAIYVVFAIVRTTKLRLISCALLAAVVIATRFEPYHYLCFCTGVAIYLLRQGLTRCPKSIRVFFLIAGLICGGYPFQGPPPASFYAWPRHLVEALSISSNYYYSLGATLLLLGVMTAPSVQKALSASVCRFFGRISFGLYLVHFIVLGALLMNLFIAVGSQGTVAMILCIFIYLAVSITSAFAFTIWIDEPAQALASRISRLRWPVRSPEMG